MGPSRTPLSYSNAANARRPHRAEPLQELLHKSRVEKQKRNVVLRRRYLPRRPYSKVAASARNPRSMRQQLTPSNY